MSAQRIKIRNFAVSLLKNKTLAGDRVFSSKTVSNWTKNLPAINIYTADEDISEFNQSPRILKRDMTLRLEIAVACSEEAKAADELDKLMQQIEDEFEKDDTLRGNCEDIILSKIAVEFDPGGEQPIGAAQMDWLCKYTTNAPGTRNGQRAENDFNGANVDWQTEGDNTAPEAEDTINV